MGANQTWLDTKPKNGQKQIYREGKSQYESHQHIPKFPASVVTILSNRNPGTAAKFFDEQYVHIPLDRLILRGNIQKLVKVQEEVEKEEQDLKDYVNSLILSLANLRWEGEP